MAKEWSWSYSKFKNYDVCPLRHYEVDLAKNYVDSSDALTWGNEVHAAMGNACKGTTPLPDSMKDHQKWVVKYASPGLPGELKVEQQYAMTRDFQPTSWFGYNAWFRAKVDLLRIFGPAARAVDWKTGKMLHEPRQLMLSSQVIFAHHPQVQRIHTDFVWFKEDCSTPEVFDRATIHREWPVVLDRVKQMEDAARTMTYPPKPGRLCARYCPVQHCQFHGKRHS